MDRLSCEYLNLINEIQKYPNLDIQWKSEHLFVKGTYKFCGSYNGFVCEDTFDLTIEIPLDYPKRISIAHETWKKIPKEYHKNTNTELCLGTEIDLYMLYDINHPFTSFMEKILNPYLYRWLYLKSRNREPWPDRSHGKQGIIESYSELLLIPKDSVIIRKFVSILALGNARMNYLCPCGSGIKLKKCHMHKLKKLITRYPNSIFQKDYILLSSGV